MSDNAKPQRATGWTGWVAFCGMMLVLLGSFHAIEGLVAVFDSAYSDTGSPGLVARLGYPAWGWLQAGLGAVAVLTGVGVLSGNSAARVGGVVFAAASAVTHLLFSSASTAGTAIVVAIDVIVIYALVAHGREITLRD
ncbi:hypothetical protein BAY61_10070 [Prauserella marina]|uniref:DUF7144 domain-containing protein n=1 Tax=Prauserella marina TaxID=530584 RepID=A0A222VNE7_9PSEU|nr:hypothetical protein [Prauserella marina]ASR35283.1 hypothetical protein BAY61_10070 [Prauserella marina]PWV84941.1 hypothetical protein DES30_101960 [Prauserella marina]SDC08780.1 hypothetical protein SAMN05421630_101377 [Prauserella marina]